MDRKSRGRTAELCASVAVALVMFVPAHGATKAVDLDAQQANGAESQCDLNVLQTFPVMIENRVTNRAAGKAFDFVWRSAGPGGFTSSAATGTTGGVGAKWVWTTNQSVYSYTGGSCDNDICFAQTEGADPAPGRCSLACLDDGVLLAVAKGATVGDTVVSWPGGTGPFTVYRAAAARDLAQPANAVGTTELRQYSDRPPAGSIFFYAVKAAVCQVPKDCASNSDCNPATEGICASRGPFSVPGRSLTATAVTVSSASLTSSLVTFFSPPKEVFRVTSTAQPGGLQERLTNGSTADVTATTEAFPLGCCPADPGVPHQLRCGDACVDFLNDPLNCGACGNVCGDGTCCSNGNCTSLCAEGQTWCNGACVDFDNDSANCGGCGISCGEESCCSEGVCASVCPEGQTYCDGRCADLQNDSANCGTCGTACGDDACCNGGSCESVCAAGQVWCDGQCADVQDDSANCGACGNVCGDDACCSDGVCESVCAAGQVWCNGQCADVQNDSANCGACGNACGDGTCCSDGVCESVCAVGQVWCDGQCADVQDDSANCGACGNACGDGACCNGGICESVCEAGRTLCGELCYDLENDPMNCGACGNVCGGESICTNGGCQPCPRQAGEDNACDNRCVNLNTDPYNCGACGVSCNLSCPSGFKGVCSNGQSCRCEEGDPAPQPPSNTPLPTEPVCANPNPSPGPVPGVCPNPHPSPGPVAGVCPNPDPSSGPVPGVCPNPTPSSGPVDPVCPNASPSSPVPGVCPSSGPLGPGVAETPVCVVNPETRTIAAGASVTTCRPGGLLFKEVPTVVSVCGDGIPGPDGVCRDGVSNVSTGTFMRLLPDTQTAVGNAYVTPFAVHVTGDTSNDGLLQPGETANLVIEVLNAGPVDVVGANAVLLSSAVDLTEDGFTNPVGITVAAGSASYGTIFGIVPSTNCESLALRPASNAAAFQVTVPPDHPGDTSHPFTLQFTGTVGGSPFSMDVPIALGIADRCDYLARTRDYDGLDGLLSPMAKLVPVGDPVPFPTKNLNAGNTVPLKVRQLCGEVNLLGEDVDAPEIIGLSESTRGPLDLAQLTLNDDANSNDPFFRWNDSTKQWIFNMRTSQIGTGTFTLTIRIAGRKEYVTGFVLR